MKRIFIVSLLCLVMVSCASQQVVATTTLTSTSYPTDVVTVLPTSTFTLTPYILQLTPELTATPISFDSSTESIGQIISDTFHTPLICKNDGYPTEASLPYTATPSYVEQEKPEFVDVTNQLNIDKSFVREIADSKNKTYRAYLVDEPVPEACNNCFRNRVYSMNVSTGQIYRISWSGYKSARIIFRMTWIGDNILAFEQSLSPHVGEIVAVNVEKQIFAFHLITFDACRETMQ